MPQPGYPPGPQLVAPARPSPAQDAEQQRIEELERILGGELPGAGYEFAEDPEKRQANLVQTDAEYVRAALLRAAEVVGIELSMPFGLNKKADLGKALLAISQSYLLLDPTVDAEGVSVDGRAEAQAKAVAKFPPRVQPNPAEKAEEAKNKGKTEALSHTRADTPRPKPRVGA